MKSKSKLANYLLLTAVTLGLGTVSFARESCPKPSNSQTGNFSTGVNRNQGSVTPYIDIQGAAAESLFTKLQELEKQVPDMVSRDFHYDETNGDSILGLISRGFGCYKTTSRKKAETYSCTIVIERAPAQEGSIGF